jgi:hypothetical protein
MTDQEICGACFGTGFEPRMRTAPPAEAGVPIKQQAPCPSCGGTGRKGALHRFYVGGDTIQRCRDSMDTKMPDSISGLPIAGGKPGLFTGIVVAIDPNPSSPSAGREWRITLFETNRPL